MKGATLAVLSKTVTVLTFLHDEVLPTYGPDPAEEDDSRDTRVVLDREVWDDLGRPAEITVTIEPGDHLNPPLAAA